jgi:centractin
MEAQDEFLLPTNQPVVLDNGSGILKAGYAGDEKPKCVFPSIVGRPKHQRVMAGSLEGDLFIGSQAQEHRGMLLISYPMEHGLVVNWEDMEQVWSSVFKDHLKTSVEEHPVLVTEPPMNPRRSREKLAEIFFETFNVPALFISTQAVLSLYASGKTTGVVLDSGDGVTHCVPVYEGFALPHAIRRADLAGRDVTRHLQLLLRKAGTSFTTSAEMQIVQQIKEECCYVAFDPAKEEDDPPVPKTYRLPDGSSIQIGPESFRAPEILFRPERVGHEFGGLHDMVVESINMSDMDLRRTLYQNILLSGGTTMMEGLGKRLLNEVKNKCAVKDMKIKILAPPERKFSTWIGGSILASLGTFRRMSITAEEYKDDSGDKRELIHSKTFF